MENKVINCMQEIRDTYRDYSENLEWDYPASRPFCEVKEFISQSVLFKIFQEMPKCSLLHIHDAAGISTEGFIELLDLWESSENTQEIYIVSKQGGKKKPGTLLYHPNGELAPFCESLKDFFNRQDSRDALKNLISFSSVERMEGIPYIWDEFNNIFVRTGDLFSNRNFYYYYHMGMFYEMIEDRIEYGEIRCSFTDFEDAHIEFAPWNVIDKDIPFLDVLNNAAAAALERWNERHSDDQRKFAFKVILCARRDLDILDNNIEEGHENQGDKMLLKIDCAIVIKHNQKYADMIAGFDLVSEEDRGKKTYTLFSRGIYQNALEGYSQSKNIVKGANMLLEHSEFADLRIKMIDLYLHDGESLWADNDNMLDAVVMARHRIGHGFVLSKFPALIREMVSEDKNNRLNACEPFLEICPISNQMLRYYGDLRAHCAYELIKSGIQCVLGNDDPMILGNPGLSYDFWEAYVGMGLTMKEIKCLVFNAFVCEYLAMNNYPTEKIENEGEEYVIDVGSLITEFNRNYWGPFLQRAYGVLCENGLVV